MDPPLMHLSINMIKTITWEQTSQLSKKQKQNRNKNTFSL